MMSIRAAACAAVATWSLAAHAAPHREAIPARHDGVATRAQTWTHTGAWQVSPAEWTSDGGNRVAALIELDDNGGAPALEARGIEADLVGPWKPMEQTFAGEGHRVMVVDLAGVWRGAELRVADGDAARVGDIAWELLIPRYPEAGVASREGDPLGALFAVSPALQTIGVIDRAGWGARATQCSATEDDWYRMAIHHTAGSQTSGGTVEGALRATQAYTMDSGSYCDLPYQFMVGFDGTLYEGRSLALQSGATGGGNNDGNIAVCFLGCYHPNSCPGGDSHVETEAMMDAAQLLVQTLVRQETIATSDQDIRGHRDWPGNSTACPGDFVHARLGELRADLAWFSAEETARTFPQQVAVATPVEVVLEVRNTGGLTWQPGETFLGTAAPRDGESALYHASWQSPTRAATVAEPVAPGAVGRFAFSIVAPDAGDYTQSFALVQEGTTWFADAPWGGGPADDAFVLAVTASTDGPDGPDDPNDPADDPTGDESDNGVSAGCAVGIPGGNDRRGPGGAAALLVIALAARRRRR